MDNVFKNQLIEIKRMYVLKKCYWSLNFMNIYLIDEILKDTNFIGQLYELLNYTIIGGFI